MKLKVEIALFSIPPKWVLACDILFQTLRNFFGIYFSFHCIVAIKCLSEGGGKMKWNFMLMESIILQFVGLLIFWDEPTLLVVWDPYLAPWQGTTHHLVLVAIQVCCWCCSLVAKLAIMFLLCGLAVPQVFRGVASRCVLYSHKFHPLLSGFSQWGIITIIIILITTIIIIITCLCLVLSGSRQLASVVIKALLALGDIILQGEVQQSLLQGDSNKAFKLPFLGHIFLEGLTSSHLEEGSTVVIHHPGLGAATVVGCSPGVHLWKQALAHSRLNPFVLQFSVHECRITFFRCCACASVGEGTWGAKQRVGGGGVLFS